MAASSSSALGLAWKPLIRSLSWDTCLLHSSRFNILIMPPRSKGDMMRPGRKTYRSLAHTRASGPVRRSVLDRDAVQEQADGLFHVGQILGRGTRHGGLEQQARGLVAEQAIE